MIQDQQLDSFLFDFQGGKILNCNYFRPGLPDQVVDGLDFSSCKNCPVVASEESEEAQTDIHHQVVVISIVSRWC